VVVLRVDGPGPRAAAAVPVLVNALADREAVVRITAAWALASIGPGVKDALPALRKALDDSDHSVRAGAAYALCRAGDLQTGLRLLIAALKAPYLQVRHDACPALARLGSAARPAVPALVALVEARQEPAYGHACGALRGIGREAREALSVLLAAVQ